jgi:hypothetical protein
MGLPLAILNPDSFAVLPGSGKTSSAFRIQRIGPSDPERAGLERFIEQVFFNIYQARVGHFCKTLIGCRDESGAWVAALGLTLPADGEIYLEQYLDVPIEAAIAATSHSIVTRRQIAEVGNLAALHRGAARALIVFMTRHLQSLGLSWVTFTATRSLLNSFTRLHIETDVLADADPERLPDGGKSWGRYYETKPQVMFGNIQAGYAALKMT